MRNPKTASTLTSPYAPAVGASLAGLALGVYPSKPLRVSVAVYVLFRALEFGWNCAEDNGMVWGWEKGANGRPARKRARPSWWGSWMLQPFAFGQLFHALVFDRDCLQSVSLVSCSPCNAVEGPGLTRARFQLHTNLILNNSATYLPSKPEFFPSSLRWPQASEIVDSLAQMAHLSWP